MDDAGVVRYVPYNRFPPGVYLLVKLAILPASDNLSARLYAARILMLLLFAAAAVLAYLSLCRLTSNRWVALTATLLAFSSYYPLYYNDMIAPDGIPDFFGVMLTFHGMVVFAQEGRFRQMIAKTCIALLLGWHVLALLLAFFIFGLVRDLLRARSAAATSPHPRYVKLKHGHRGASQSIPAAGRSCAGVRPIRSNLQLRHGVRRAGRRDAANRVAVLPIHAVAHQRRSRLLAPGPLFGRAVL